MWSSASRGARSAFEGATKGGRGSFRTKFGRRPRSSATAESVAAPSGRSIVRTVFRGVGTVNYAF